MQSRDSTSSADYCLLTYRLQRHSEKRNVKELILRFFPKNCLDIILQFSRCEPEALYRTMHNSVTMHINLYNCLFDRKYLNYIAWFSLRPSNSVCKSAFRPSNWHISLSILETSNQKLTFHYDPTITESTFLVCAFCLCSPL